MKKVDIKSFLIGVLITTNLFFFMGFSSTNKIDEIDDILKIVKYIRSETIDIDERTSTILSRIGSDGLIGRDTIFKKLDDIESDLLNIPTY